MHTTSRPPQRRHIATRFAATLAVAGLLAFGVALPNSASASSAPTPIVPTPVTPLVPVAQNGATLGKIGTVSQEGAEVTLTAANGAARVTFLDSRTVRVEADPSGVFTDPANTPQGDDARTADIIVGASSFDGTDVALEQGDIIKIATDAVVLEIDRVTTRMTLRTSEGRVVWEESAPISFGENSATQHLTPREDEQFLGGGMQNGRSIHTGATINIARSSDWDDDGYPNAVPYYMTSNGYGVLRNTFAPGSYSFTAETTTTHEERRFDAYYFVGDYKEALNGYTALTGRPIMPPVYALEYGDADCYNRSSETYKTRNPNNWNVPGKLRTPDALEIARDFVENDMPGGWMLVNDGYGCEYVELPETSAAIEEETGLKTGLWTERSLSNQEYEVGQADVRLRKLDVAWVGSGYRLALTGCEAAHDGIEQYSDARGTALMVEGWAGSQRCGMQWTGDHTGSLDAIRWQISALTGSGNSGLAFTTGDVDGIFGGSATSYVRDLQWKAFVPALYSMSGWASVDKRPWLYGDEATEINRKYLQLRQRLMPYIYTLAAESHRSGTPMMRSLALEYPQDPFSYGAEANTEFLLGEDFLVAPVYTAGEVRNGIYLPEGQWVDYWSGTLFDGGRVLDGYRAPLDTLPLFVRAGAVIPQGIVARNSSLVPEDSAITLDVFPQGESSFELYEDDEVTRGYAEGESSRQVFSVAAPQQDGGDVVVTIGTREGEYDGKADARPYALDVHTGTEPEAVRIDETALEHFSDEAAFAAADSGWYFDAENRGGIVQVKTGAISSVSQTTVTLVGASAVGGTDSDAARAHVSVSLAAQVFQGEETTMTATFHNSGTKAKTDVVIAPQLPEGWTVVSAENTDPGAVAAGSDATATFVIRAGAESGAGTQTLGAEGSFTDSQGTARAVIGAAQINVAYSSIAAAFDTVSITSVATKDAGNFDGGGASFSEDALAAAGARAGEVLTVQRGEDSIDFQWPDADAGTANSMSMNGQTIALSGTGTHLAFLGSAATGSGAAPEFTVTYADGTTATQSFYFPNWLIQNAGPLRDAVVAVESKGRNSKANPEGYEYATTSYQVYASVAPLNPTKELRSVTFPVGTTAKLFDMRPVTLGLPDAPQGDVWVSDLDWTSATNGWGIIGKDIANKDAEDSPDVPLVINTTAELKKTYEKGLGVHANSKVTYYLGGQCTRFTADAGLEAAFTGSVIFSVDVDDVKRYQGTTFQAGFPTEKVDVDVTGASYIDLIVDAPGSINGAHGVWGDARLECGGETPEVLFSAEAGPRVMGAKTYLLVRATNDDAVPVDVTIETVYGAKTFAAVEPGKTVSNAFTVRSGALESGEATVTVSKTVEGEKVTSERRVAYQGG